MPKDGDVGEVVIGHMAENMPRDELANGGIGGFGQAPKHRCSLSLACSGRLLGPEGWP